MQNQLLEIANSKYPQGAVEIANWVTMINQLAGVDLLQQVKTVNEFFNRRIYYAEDAYVWRDTDYWATPCELLNAARGDCEDYAIAKYVSLRLLDIPDDMLRIMYVYVVSGNTRSAHMVMGIVTPDNECYVLDNMISSIRTLSMRPDLVPVFSFNTQQLWTHDQLTTENPVHRLSRWQNLLMKLTEDGITL